MLRQRQATVLIFVLLSACGRPPEYYVPPEQRNPYELTPSKSLTHYIHMSAPNAPDHFVEGVLPKLHDGTWRWVMKRPVFQFRTPTREGLKLHIDLTVPDITFEQTGPVQIEVRVGSQTLDRISFDKPGQQIWEKAVPPEWILPDATVLVTLEIDKLWRSPTDGAERGFIITQIGFVQ